MFAPLSGIQNEFSSPWHGGDVVFVVEGRQLYCSKAVLTMVSPVFEAMFERDFKEKTSHEVPLPEKKYNDMVEFFRCIHPHINKDVTEENLEALLNLAEEYQCEMLTKKCRSCIAAFLEQCRVKTATNQNQFGFVNISGNAVLRCLRLTDQFFEAPDLVGGLVEELQVRMPAGQLTGRDHYKGLSVEVMRLLFQRYTSKMDEQIRNLTRDLQVEKGVKRK